MSDVTLDWKGDELLRKIRAAERRALVKVAGRIVTKAVPRAPYKETILRGSIRHDPPETTSEGVSILVGSFDVEYALRQEKGFHGADSLGRVFAQPGKFYMQTSHDEEAPGLARQIQDEMGA